MAAFRIDIESTIQRTVARPFVFYCFTGMLNNKIRIWDAANGCALLLYLHVCLYLFYNQREH